MYHAHTLYCTLLRTHLRHTLALMMMRADRYLDKTARKYETAIKSVGALNAFNMKYEHGAKHGAGGILGGDDVRSPEPASPPQRVPQRKAPVSSPGTKASSPGKAAQAGNHSAAGKARGAASGSANKGLGRKYVDPRSGGGSAAQKTRAPISQEQVDPIRLSFPGARPPPPGASFAWPHKPTSWIPQPNATYGHYRSSA